MPLITELRLQAPDDFYQALIDAHCDLDAAQSHELNAKLVLLLANHVGNLDVIGEALAAARRSVLSHVESTQAPPPVEGPS